MGLNLGLRKLKSDKSRISQDCFPLSTGQKSWIALKALTHQMKVLLSASIEHLAQYILLHVKLAMSLSI